MPVAAAGIRVEPAGNLRRSIGAKPSHGLEPWTPSLPCAFAGNWSRTTALVSACFCRFPGLSICHWLRLVVPARLQNCSMFDEWDGGVGSR